MAGIGTARAKKSVAALGLLTSADLQFGSDHHDRARRRADRRRRAVRHRRRVPPADGSARARPTRSSRRATRIGGTWDLFRYPGVRSDSDMYTLGYRFRPWTRGQGDRRRRRRSSTTSATTAARGRHRPAHPLRPSGRARGLVERGRALDRRREQHDGEPVAARPALPVHVQRLLPLRRGLHARASRASSGFGGPVVHPQHWPEDLDYAGKRVVVIGSGATAVTLVPAMAEQAAHVTMLQRSPTYIVVAAGRGPDREPAAQRLGAARRLRGHPLEERRCCTLASTSSAGAARAGEGAADPQGGDRRSCRPATTSTRTSSPRYNPWDQRLCLVPDGDLFRRSATGTAVGRHRPDRRRSPRPGSGSRRAPSSRPTSSSPRPGSTCWRSAASSSRSTASAVALPETMAYKGMMLRGVPNLAFAFGYTNASWTLKADLVCEYVCRLLDHMDAHGYDQCVPVNDDPSVSPAAVAGLLLGVRAARDRPVPEAGSKAPWRVRPELPSRPDDAAVPADQRRRAAVHPTGSGEAGRGEGPGRELSPTGGSDAALFAIAQPGGDRR